MAETEWRNKSILQSKSHAFASRMIRLHGYLISHGLDYSLARQLVRCGTSIGANIAESNYAQSKPDFITKLSIALKEANETKYWLELFHENGFINDKGHESLQQDLIELLKLLTSILKTIKNKADP